MNSAVVWSMVSCLVYFQLSSSAPVTLTKAGEESLKFSKFFEAKKANGQDLSLLTDVGTSLECETCKLFSGVLADFLEKGGPEEDVAKLAKVFCILLKIEDKNVCDSVVEEFKREVLTVAYSITLGRAKQLCAILLGPSCQARYNPKDQPLWKIPVPGNKPPVKPIPDPKVFKLKVTQVSTWVVS